MIQLSKRLQAVADLAMEGRHTKNIICLADVGTDHGYIPIYLVEQGFCRYAIAMDIGKGPLQRAKDHIAEHRMENYIETRLSDGLAALKPYEVSIIVIAGMGGATMQHILEEGKNVILPDTTLILQPQSELFEFRSYLMEQGFVILQEDMVCEDGKFYPMLKVQKAGTKQEYTDLELLFGPLLLQKKHVVLQEFLHWQLEQKEKILKKLQISAQPQVREKRMEQVQKEICEIQQALSMCEGV